MSEYQLVLQIPDDSITGFEILFAIEEELIEALGEKHEMDGHDVGSGTINYFVYTHDPMSAMQLVRSIFVNRELLDRLRAAYRSVETVEEGHRIVEEASFINVFPENDERRFDYMYRRIP